MIYKNNGRIIGEFDGKVFRKTVSKKKHLFRANNSWGIQAEVLRELPEEARIEIFAKDEKMLYITTVKQFKDFCIYLQFGDFGLQAFLPLEKFRTEKPTTRVLKNAQWN